METCPECGSEHEAGRPIAVHWSMSHSELEQPDDLTTSTKSKDFEDPVDCPECGQTCEGVNGLNVHWGRNHDGEIPIDNSRSEEVREKIAESIRGTEGPWADAEPEEMPMYGKSHDEETKQKISEAVEGREVSEEERRRISETLRGRSGRFKPREEYPSDWEWVKKKVRERDGYRCVRCRIPEVALPRNLSVHHINRNKEDCSLSNLVSLCNSCHAESQFNPFFYSV